MKWLLAIALLAACVPPTGETDPKGAAGIRTEPTPATRGEPFVTDDGWTVTIDALYLRGFLFALSQVPGTGSENIAQEYVWNARERHELFVPAVREGRALVKLDLTPGYPGSIVDNDFVLTAGVPEAVARRFSQSEEGSSPFGASAAAPAVVLVATGVKDGVRVVVDVAFSSSSDTTRSLPVDVVRNDLRLAPFPVAGEELFAYAGDGMRLFQPLADADVAPRDGRVTTAEVSTVKAECVGRGTFPAPDASPETRCSFSLVDLLRMRAPVIVGAPALVVGGRLGSGQAPDANP